MKKLFGLLPFLFIAMLSVHAQTTAVSANVVDSDSIAWASGTYAITYSNHAPGKPYNTSTGAFITTHYSGNLNGSGQLTGVTLDDVDFINPGGGTWIFTICPDASGGTGNCGTVNIPVASTSSGDLSSQINAAIKAPRPGGGVGAFGYADVEFQSIPNNTYIQSPALTSCRLYTNSWGGCGSGGGGSPAWSALTNPSTNLSLTMGTNTSNFVNTPVFTTGQINQNWILNGGGVDFGTEFQNFQNAFTSGTYFFSDENDIGLNVTSGSTIYQANALGLYMICSSTTTDCVPIYTQARRGASGAPIWGGNVNAWDNSLGGANQFGFEIDDIVGSTTTTGEDLRLLSKVVSGATFNGIHFVPASGVLTNAILLDNFAATNAINIGEAVGGTSSMPIVFNDSSISANLALQHVGSGDYLISSAPIGTTVNNTTGVVGLFTQQSATTPYAVLQTIGNVSFQGVDVTSAYDWSLSFGPQSSLGGPDPYFSVYSGGWKTAWHITASSQATTFAGAVSAPTAAVGNAGQFQVNATGDIALTDTQSSSSLLIGSFIGSGINTSGQMYFNFGQASTTNNSVYQAFHYAGSGSSSNWYGSSFAGVTANNYALFPNGSSAFGETTPAAGPANGITVGTTGQFQVDGSGIPQIPHYIVSALPAAGAAGRMVVVTDATAFTAGTCTGSGSDTVLAISNGTSWVCQ